MLPETLKNAVRAYLTLRVGQAVKGRYEMESTVRLWHGVYWLPDLDFGNARNVVCHLALSVNP